MYKIDYKVKNSYNPSQLSETKLLGSIGEKLDRVIYERLSGEYAQTEVFAEAESAFEHCTDGDNAPIGSFQGEFWGKQIVSACRAYKYTKDESLLQFIKESCARIIAHQREDGFLGTYKDPKQIFRCPERIGIERLGWPCNWNWNIWGRKYTLWALLEAYEVTGDEKLLDVAVKATNQLIDMLEEMGARICETGTLDGQPSGSILKPILVLYRVTGNKKYLDFALEIAKEWEDEETCCTKLIPLSLRGVPVHEWGQYTTKYTPQSKYNPYGKEGEPVFSLRDSVPELKGKVYEMQSCFDGMLELYRVTGVEKYFEAAKCYFELLVEYEYNTLCSVGFNDKFLKASKYQNSLSELCDVIHFMRLATELHRLTGEARYLDYAELGFVNCFLAGVTRNGAWGARCVRAAEAHLFIHDQAGFSKNHCCVNNMPRGFFNIAETFVTANKDEVMVNLYTKAKVTVHPMDGEDVTVEISDGYLQKCAVTLKISANLKARNARTLKLRIPEWSKYTVVITPEKTLALNESGCYYSLPLSNGETEITIKFDNTPRLIEGKYEWDFYPLTPLLTHNYRANVNHPLNLDTLIDKNHATLFIGPVLLARTLDLGATFDDIRAKETVVGGNYTVKAVPIDVDGTACAYELSFSSPDENRKDFTIKMCDFASASDTEEYKEYRYTIFI